VPELPDPEIGDLFINPNTGQIVRVVQREFVGNGTTSTLVALDLAYVSRDKSVEEIVAGGVSMQHLRQRWTPWSEPPLDDPAALEVWLDD